MRKRRAQLGRRAALCGAPAAEPPHSPGVAAAGLGAAPRGRRCHLSGGAILTAEPGQHLTARISLPRVGAVRSPQGLSAATGLPRPDQDRAAAILLPEAGHIPAGRRAPASGRAAPHCDQFTASSKGDCLWGTVTEP